MSLNKPIMQRILEKRKIDSNGCWLWAGYIHPNGAGMIGYKGRSVEVYRVIMNAKRGQQVNHKCNNRTCFNPEHLYFGTQKENIRDSILANTHIMCESQNVAKTHCPNGHEYDTIDYKGARRCSVCDKKHKAKYKQRKRKERIEAGAFGRKLKTTCKHGHTGQYIYVSGKRRCKACLDKNRQS